MQELWILWSYHFNSVTFKYKYRKVTLKQNVPYYTMSLVPIPISAEISTKLKSLKFWK